MVIKDFNNIDEVLELIRQAVLEEVGHRGYPPPGRCSQRAAGGRASPFDDEDKAALAGVEPADRAELLSGVEHL